MSKVSSVAFLFWSAVVVSASAAPAQTAVLLTVQTPAPEQFELAVNELELQWRDNRGRATPQPAAPKSTTGARLASIAEGRATFTATGARTLLEMRPLAADLEKENPGTMALLVLYEAGKPRSEATRRLLGREVAVLFSSDVDFKAIIDRSGAVDSRPFEGLPRAYVATAADPLAALDLATALRSAAGVATAYPLLQRRQFAR